MDQLIKGIETSCLTNIVLGVFIMTATLSVNGIAHVDGNCTFDTIVNTTSNPWTILGDSVSEKTSPSSVIWNVTTKNIEGSISSYHPHTKYLTGHRYKSYYVYRASDHFPTFVDVENSIEITRSVTFTCSNNAQIKVNFRFPLQDVNDAPVFLQVPNKELRATLGTPEIINENDPIVVLDKDFNNTYNNVRVTTDRPDVLLIDSIVNNKYDKIGKKFDIKLKLNLTGEPIVPGRYSLNLFASDEQFTINTNVKILISK